MSQPILPWIPERELGAKRVRDAILQLEEYDMPLLHMEAVLVYTSERLPDPENEHKLRVLADAGVLTEQTLSQWLKLNLAAPARKILEEHRRNLLGRRPTTHHSGRICCPVIVRHWSPLLPDTRLSGIRWIEVVARGSRDPVAFGFPEEWYKRLKILAEQVQTIINTPLDGQRPRWNLLDSLGQRIVGDSGMDRRSASLELGACLAYACWAMRLRPNQTIAATGKIGDDGAIETIDDPLAKMIGIGREAAFVELIVVPNGAEERGAVPTVPEGTSICFSGKLETALACVTKYASLSPSPQVTADALRSEFPLSHTGPQPDSSNAFPTRAQPAEAARPSPLSGKVPSVLSGSERVGETHHVKSNFSPSESSPTNRLEETRNARRSRWWAPAVAGMIGLGLGGITAFAIAWNILLGLPRAQEDASLIQDSGFRGPSTPAVPFLDASGVPASARAVDSADAGNQRCENEGEHHVCMARLTTRLFTGVWHADTFEEVRWDGPSRSESLVAGIRSVAFDWGQTLGSGVGGCRLRYATHDGGVSLITSTAYQPPFFICVEETSGTFRFCGGVKTRGNGPSAPSFGYRFLYINDYSYEHPHVVDALMGLDLLDASGATVTDLPREFNVRWASRNIAGPFDLLLRRTAEHHSRTSIDQEVYVPFRNFTEEYGEVRVTIPGGWNASFGIHVCLISRDQRFEFCRRALLNMQSCGTSPCYSPNLEVARISP